MPKIQPNIQNEEVFCPWDHDKEMELVGITASLTEMSKLPNKNEFFRGKKALKEQYTQGIEDQAKKTLLHIDEHQKTKNTQFLKNYLYKKKEGTCKKQIELDQNISSFRLPPINSRKHTLKIKQSSRKSQSERKNQLVEDIREEYNEQEHIFRKYGQHKKRHKAISVQRSYSLGNQSFKIANQLNDAEKKYQTRDVTSLREKKNQNLFMQREDLQLKGKKYSYQTRGRNKKHQEANYIPVNPNITPHYMFFGHKKEDILKKVLKQLHHKFKDKTDY